MANKQISDLSEGEITDNNDVFMMDTHEGITVKIPYSVLKQAINDNSVPLAMIAPEFDKTKTYAVGEHIIYNRELYQCITSVETAGEWDSSKWNATTVTEILKGT